MIWLGALLRGIGGFIAKVPWQVWAFLLFAAGVFLYGHTRFVAGVDEQSIVTAKVEKERDDSRAEFTAYKEQVRIAIAAKLKANLLRERADAAAFKLANDNLRTQNEKSKADAARTIADLRSGALQLRDRFQCKTQPANTGPEAAAGTSGRDGAQESGLQIADAEFFVQFADEADQAVNQLNACQDILEAERTPDPVPGG